RGFVPHADRIDRSADADGFTVPTEALTLNGPGVEGIGVLPKQPVQAGGGTESGALNNLAGNNTWVQPVSLWSADSTMRFLSTVWEWPTVGIGVERNSQLTLTGVLNDNNISGPAPLPNTDYSLIKTRPGRLILAPQATSGGNVVGLPNTYRGRTEVLEGYLNIRDSQALGATGSARNGTVVFPGG